MDEWWGKLFASDQWYDVATAIEPERTGAEADLLVRLLELRPGARLLDVPCGPGRHAIELAGRGMRVTGLDITPALLAEARRRAAERNLEIEWIEGDMRAINRDAEFDAAYCFFGSFGYFDHAGNVEFLNSVARSLRPGARFLIDTHVAESLLPKLQPRGFTRQAGMIITEERRYDHAAGCINVVWTFLRDGHPARTSESSMMIYTYRELAAMLRDAGFGTVEGYDTSTGRPFAFGASRLAIVAQR